MLDHKKLDEVIKVSTKVKQSVRADDTVQIAQYLESNLPFELFDNPEYTEKVILESLNLLRSQNLTLTLPMIEKDLQKKDALPKYMQGLLWDEWARNESDGTTVFLQNYEDRGANNLKKKAYVSGLTPDLYAQNYEPKVQTFFECMFAPANTNSPLMDIYRDHYLDLYWSLHLKVAPQDIPDYAKQIGLDFINCWAIFTPLNLDNPEQSLSFKTSYEYVRANRAKLIDWISSRVQEVRSNPDQFKDTFVYHWLENAGDGEGAFRDVDITFECFHNYLALSQWGHTIYKMMNLLRDDNTSDKAQSVKTQYQNIMSSDYNATDSSGFSPLDYLALEFFREIVPNGGSISRYYATGKYSELVDEINAHAHKPLALSAHHWDDPFDFNPDRFRTAPKSDSIDVEAFKQVSGSARCPFTKSAIHTSDGRSIENNLYGTDYARKSDGTACPVIETAGFSPFGFGYRRCPGELLTIGVFKTFLKFIWNNKISFHLLDDANPEVMPIAPATFITDNIGMKINN
ncbi:hypothetical protein [Alteromonas sp. a30]|uniref:hypothetical protein n=1 Tax=Alteromonas sp. a30 TaxID=2730917 RepID=UPI0022825B71|nr:hypothetical protein [Alteromonas sp. a30]MCY7295395.1 hypothetical protein [Alteromonas sp. a30]